MKYQKHFLRVNKNATGVVVKYRGVDQACNWPSFINLRHLPFTTKIGQRAVLSNPRKVKLSCTNRRFEQHQPGEFE
jgi:hypothetical protein